MDIVWPELPVTEHRDEILAAVRSHPVVIVCGDTGSGKTTQLPKMALALGRGARGRRIAVTQPRRLAAVTMAARVAEELGAAGIGGGSVGGIVGYQHRFARAVSAETRVKFMTDGVLLAETRADRMLSAYDTIIVDEAHERSLNVDFLLGILKRILERRRDLKVIVASATMDTASFSAFFGNAPVINVPGRLYPVDVRYSPPPEDDERDLARDVADAVALLPRQDDILVFLPGERDIRETADTLRLRYGDGANDVIPLLASLPAGEQQRAFRPSSRRRIVLATNVAETSVTIPGIRAVIDSGLARISRYVHRTQVQRLQIEPISQASARQRAGRCGRLGPGTCIRLYSEEDFLSRDAYTPPEVLRSSLAGVILTMLDLGLGDIAEFPFIDPPRPAMIHEGLKELLELGAIGRAKPKGERRDAGDQGAGQKTKVGREIVLTDIGRKLAKIPVEPRLARMLVSASENATLVSALPIVAALSCDDPRRRPIDEREKADQAHARFRVAGSDFLGTLGLWRWWEAQTEALSQSKARALAKKNYLSYPKMREWRDLVRQLTELAKRIGLSFSENAAAKDASERLHRSLLAGLLGRIGRYDEEERDYRGAHGLRFALHPSSVLTKRTKREDRSQPKNPPWLVAGELVDTARLFARNAAAIDPEWIEPVAGEICRHSYHSPMWDAQSGYARVTEQVTLYGLVIVPARRRDLSGVDPKLAREILVKDGILGDAFPHPPPTVREALAFLRELRQRAETLRRPEIFDETRLFEHFDRTLPPDVTSADALRRWLRRATPAEIAAFRLRREEWWPKDEVTDRDFPDRIRIGGVTLALSYRHTPDEPETDGITCTVRRSDVGTLRLWQSEWLVPGALPEKLVWMISVLPGSLRRVLTPLDEKVTMLMAKLRPGAEPLAEAVRRIVREEWGFRIPEDAWRNQTPPTHLRVRFCVREDRGGKVLLVTRSKDEALEKFSAMKAQAATPTHGRRGVSLSWNFGTIPEKTSGDHAGWEIVRYPALHDEGEGVTLRLYDDAAAARQVHDAGVTRLLRLALASELRLRLRSRDLTLDAARYLKEIGYEVEDLADDIFAGAVKSALVSGREAVRTEGEFVRRADDRRAVLAAQTEISRLALSALTEGGRLLALAESDARVPDETAADVSEQLVWLLARGFPARVTVERLRHFARYLKGVAIRLDRARNSASSDRAKAARLSPHWRRYVEAATGKGGTVRNAAALDEYRWLVEEYRVSLFAQELRTPVPVSDRRLDELFGRISLF